MRAIIEAEGLSRIYQIQKGMFAKPQQLAALAEASFSVEAGKTLGVVGESGCGKSTLARVITMIEPASAGSLVIDGRVVSGGTSADLKLLRSTVQIVFQDPYGALNPRQKIGSIIEEPLLINTDLTAAERRARCLAMMAEVGLRPEHYGRYPHMFSGGQRQRIATARALILEPKILVLDEPVSALDVSIRAQILNLLADLQHKHGLTYIFISHDLGVIKHVADQVLVMYLGRAVEIASAKVIFDSPRHPYTQALLSATPVADPTQRHRRIELAGEPPSPLNPPAGCAFNPRCPLANERCRIERPELRMVRRRRIACHAVEEGRG